MANVLTPRILWNLMRLKSLQLRSASSYFSTQSPAIGTRKNVIIRTEKKYNLMPLINVKFYCTQDKDDGPKKLTLFQKFRAMYRDYWYVLLPVHLVTSSVWFGSFYYLAKSGVDISALLESWNVSETITKPLKDSSMGYLALSYALYKIATPARYTITLGGTTISINYLKKWGYIKPVPSTDRLKEMYQEKKENLIESIHETKEIYKEKKDNLMESVRETSEMVKEKKDNLMESVRETSEKVKEKKDNLMESVRETSEMVKEKKDNLMGTTQEENVKMKKGHKKR